MTTNTKQVLQLKVTLENEALESWQGLSEMFKGANTPSIVRMALINYYGQLRKRNHTSKRTPKENIELIENWEATGSKANLSRLEEQEAMSDWWMANKDELRG